MSDGAAAGHERARAHRALVSGGAAPSPLARARADARGRARGELLRSPRTAVADARSRKHHHHAARRTDLHAPYGGAAVGDKLLASSSRPSGRSAPCMCTGRSGTWVTASADRARTGARGCVRAQAATRCAVPSARSLRRWHRPPASRKRGHIVCRSLGEPSLGEPSCGPPTVLVGGALLSGCGGPRERAPAPKESARARADRRGQGCDHVWGAQAPYIWAGGGKKHSV